MTTIATLPAHPAPIASPCPAERFSSRRTVLARLAAGIGLGATANVAAIVVTRAAPGVSIRNAGTDAVAPDLIFARAKQAIEVLGDRFVCENWSLDQDAAAHALGYFQRLADGAPDDDAEWQTVAEFLGNHGISLDWIIRGDPTCLLCTSAARSKRATHDLIVDAELIALGRQLDALISRFEELQGEHDLIWDQGYGARFIEIKAALERDAALERGPDADCITGRAGERFCEQLGRIQAEWGIDAVCEKMGEQTDAMDPIMRAIMALPARSISGLAVKARSAAFTCSHYWKDGADWDQQLAGDVLAAVLALAEGELSS